MPDARTGPAVGLIMGSDSDWKTMRHAAEALAGLGVACEAKVVSAHRTPDDLFRYAEEAEGRGLALIIAGAGGAAHLPGMAAAKTVVPVIGVPVAATALRGIDALLSIMQMPAEIAVATVGVGEVGAGRAAHFAGALLAAAGRPPRVSILVEDVADREMLDFAATTLRALEIPFTMRIVGGEVEAAIREESEAGATAFIAGSRHGIDLADRAARLTSLPVLGVPLAPDGVDSVDQFVRPFLDMPAGVATFAVGKPGAINAALFAAAVLSPPGSATRAALRRRREEQVHKVRAMSLPTP